MSSDLPNNEIFEGLENERQANARHSVSFARRRLQVDKGQAALVRYLPVELLGTKRFYVRLGQHWVAGRPYNCPRVTAPELGGNEEAPCLLCDIAAKYQNSTNQFTRKEARRALATLRWITYCLVYEMQTGDAKKTFKAPDLWKPYEHQHYWSTFESLMDSVRRSVEKRPPYGVLDLVTGFDFYVVHKTKGLVLERSEEAAPIANNEDPEKFQAIINRIWENLPNIDETAATPQQLEEASDKLLDVFEGKKKERDEDRGADRDADRGGRGGGERSSRRELNDDFETESRAQRQVRGGEDERRGGGEVVEERRVAAPPVTAAAPPRAAATAPPVRTAPPPRSALPPPPARVAAGAPQIRSGGGGDAGRIDAEDDTPPEERTDLAPPAETAVAEEPGQPPVVQATGAAVTIPKTSSSPVTSRIMDRVRRMQ